VHWTLFPPIAFVAVSIVVFVAVGIPYQRDAAFVWLLIGLLCFSLTDLRGYVRGLIRDWLPFFAILVAYDSLRGTAGRLLPVHYLPQIQVDRFIFGGQAPTVTLQRWLWHGHVTWIDVAAWVVYMTHFFFTPVLAAVLWKIDRQRFRKFAITVIALSFAGLVTYALYPAAPPWIASQRHLIAPITRIIPKVWAALSVHGSGSLVETGYQYANNVAAMPSLHAAFSLLVAITVWPRRHRWLRPIVAAYPLAIAFAVVYTGEHYVSDVLLGWLYTTTVVLAAQAIARRRESQQAPVHAFAPSIS
jgi:membrane-associated phospholipid phosphatase